MVPAESPDSDKVVAVPFAKGEPVIGAVKAASVVTSKV